MSKHIKETLIDRGLIKRGSRSVFFKRGSLLLLFFLVSVFLLCAPAAAEEHGLCSEDERVLLPVAGKDIMLYYAYDEQGNCLGRLPVTGWGEYAKLVRRNALFLSRDHDRSTTLIRAGDLLPAVVYPSEEYMLFWLVRHYVTYDKKTGVVTLYDESTVPLGSCTFEKAFNPDHYLQGDLLEFTDRYLLKLTDSQTSAWFLFYKNSQAGEEIRDPRLLPYLGNEDMAVYSLGEYIVAVPHPYSEENVLGVVMTPDGDVIMDRVEDVLQEVSLEEDAPYLNYGNREDRAKVPAVVIDAVSCYEIYDSDLNYLGHVSEKPKSYGGAGNGFVKGIAYPELRGCICSGFVYDCDINAVIPYAETPQGCLIWKDGRCMELPVEGIPQRISSAYLVTRTDDGTNVYRTADAMLFDSYSMNWWSCLSLGSQGILLRDNHEKNNWFTGSATIYDNEGNPTYHSEDCHIYAFVNGTWTCRRGVYQGLIDMYGNWVLKDIINWQE